MWYSKENNKDFNANDPKRKGLRLFFELYFGLFGKIIQLNLIFLLFCLGIVTIPAAITALTYQTLKIAKDKPIFAWEGFVDTFKKYFKKSLVYGIIYGIILALIILGFYVYPRLLGTTVFAVIPFALLIAVTAIFVLMNFYPFMLILYVPSISILKLIKYSLTLAFIDAKSNLTAFACFIIIALLLWWFYPVTIIPMFVIAFSTLSFTVTFACRKNIEKHVICESEI